MESNQNPTGRRGVSHLSAGQKVQDQPALRPVRHPLQQETASAYALLPAILRRGTVRYPDLGALSAQLDRLYGASVDYTVRKKGENQCVGFVASFIDDSYAPGGEQLLEPVAELVGELLCDPVTERGRFVSTLILKVEKTNLIDAIRSQVNDKREYADRPIAAGDVRRGALRHQPPGRRGGARRSCR